MPTAMTRRDRHPIPPARGPVVLLALASLALASCGPGSSADEAPALESIRAAELSADLHFLASDAMEGRLVGTRGISLAAEWVKSRFQRLGLEPAASGDYFQEFDLIWFSLGGGNELTVSGPGVSTVRSRSGDRHYPLNFSGTGTASGEVVYAGFGIVEPRLGYDDYRGADVTGKVVLVLEGEPGVDDPESPFDGVVTAEASRTWRKALAAQERGAVAVLFVRDVHNRPDIGDMRAAFDNNWPAAPRRVERFSIAPWMEAITVPAAQIAADLAAVLVAGSGRSLQELAAAAESETGHGVLELPGPTVSLTASVERHRTPARNVVAKISGADPAAAGEVVIIGAHHDHNGHDDQGVFNGADDDGSGIVGVLEVAEAYAEAAARGERPRRTVLFAAWDAEERGLLGAWYYTEAPVFPLANTVAVLNLDMIGRNEEVPPDGGGRFRGLEVQSAESNANAINILGHSYTPDLGAAVERANGAFGLDLHFRYDNNESNLLRRSDHWPFLQRGVPAVWFHTGLHPDYHTREDDPERIEYGKMERIVRLVHQTSWDLANAAGRPAMAARR